MRINPEIPKSTTPRNKEISITRAMTTAVEPIVCLRDGQATFFSSTLTSRKNWRALVKILSLGLAAGWLVAADFIFGGAAFFLAGALAEPSLNATLFSSDFIGSPAPAAALLPAACFFFVLAA